MPVIQRKFYTLSAVAFAIGLMLTGCGGSSGSISPAPLNYSMEIQNFVVGTPIIPVAPSATGGSGNYTIQPTLPAGLSMNTSGVISGTPLAISPMTTYVITNGSGSNASTTEISFDVLSTQTLPAGLHYGTLFVPLMTGRSLQPILPRSSGGQISSYSVSPALPAGVNLDSSTGVISGTPTTPALMAKYMLTASNTAGSTTTSLVLGTQATAGYFDMRYESLSLRLQPGETMQPLKPLVVGGEVVQCSVYPALPDGMSINQSTCEISGTPKDILTQTFEVTARDSMGFITKARLPLTVSNTPAGSTSFAYSSANYSVAVNEAVLVPGPQTSGEEIVSYSATGLPAGLSINAADGTISGVPTVIAGSVPVVVTAKTVAGSAVVTNIAMTVLSTPSGTVSTVHGVQVVQTGNTYGTLITPIKYSYTNAKTYCETTITGQLGRKYVLPNTFDLILFIYLDMLQNPGNYSNWTLGKTWYEDSGSPKEIGTVDLSARPSGGGYPADMTEEYPIDTPNLFLATCRAE